MYSIEYLQKVVITSFKSIDGVGDIIPGFFPGNTVFVFALDLDVIISATHDFHSPGESAIPAGEHVSVEESLFNFFSSHNKKGKGLGLWKPEPLSD